MEGESIFIPEKSINAHHHQEYRRYSIYVYDGPGAVPHKSRNP